MQVENKKCASLKVKAKIHGKKGRGVQESKKKPLNKPQRHMSSTAEENKHETQTNGQRAGEQQVSRSKDKDRKWKVNMK